MPRLAAPAVLVALLLVPQLDRPLASASAGERPAAAFPVEEASIAELSAAMASGRTTARGLVEAYLARIAAIDQDGPRLRAVVEINPDALAIAEALDREREQKGARGPLHGIPILIKDNIDSADRMATSAGSLALAGAPPPAQDAFLVERLRAAGAVLLGKTNLSEWANFRSTHSTSGWSARGGQTRNPYALDRSPSGSSSGSGAAVAASLAAAAVGTETDGSILSPASVCGIVGIKPTVGLVSRSGIVPIAISQDTAGPMARSVADAAVLLAAMVGVDFRDPLTVGSVGQTRLDEPALLDPRGLVGARIGVVRAEAFRLGPKTTPVLDRAVRILEAQGATVVEVELDNAGKSDAAELEVLLYEFKYGLERYLGSRPGAPVRTLAELIAWNRDHAAAELAHFGQELLEQAAARGSMMERGYGRARDQALKLTRKKGIDATLKRHGLDALVAVTNGPAQLIDLVNGDAWTGGSQSPAAVAGYPSITVPAGDVAGLPVGISLFGPAWSEPRLVRYAYAFEQAARARKPPGYHPSLDPTRAEAGGTQ